MKKIYISADIEGIWGNSNPANTAKNGYLYSEYCTNMMNEVNLVIDTREGPTFGQTIADWYNTLDQPKNAFWVENGNAQGFFDLLTARLGRLK